MHLLVMQDPIHQNFFGEITTAIASSGVLSPTEILEYQSLEPQNNLTDIESLNQHINTLAAKNTGIFIYCMELECLC